MWFKNEACESKDKYDKFVESLDYWEHLHLSMVLYCLNHPDASNDEAYAECLVGGGPSLAYRLKAACHIENNSRDKAIDTERLLHCTIDSQEAKDFIKEVCVTDNDKDVQPPLGAPIGITKQPHVRIDIDNIHDAPHVWIDGERVDDMHGDKKPALTRVYVNWRTDNGSDMQSGKHEFVVQHYELDDTHVPKEIKTGERSITDKDD